MAKQSRSWISTPAGFGGEEGYSREVSCCFLMLGLLFREESGESYNIGVDLLKLSMVVV